MLPALWSHLASGAPELSAGHEPQRSHVREHGRPLEHTASRAHPAPREIRNESSA
jgi:chorismate--pyruvate lyase